MPENSCYSSMVEVFKRIRFYLKKWRFEKVFVDLWLVYLYHSLDENNKLSVALDYAPWLKVALDQLLVWTRYKFLVFEPRNEKELEQFKGHVEAFCKHNGK